MELLGHALDLGVVLAVVERGLQLPDVGAIPFELGGRFLQLVFERRFLLGLGAAQIGQVRLQGGDRLRPLALGGHELTTHLRQQARGLAPRGLHLVEIALHAVHMGNTHGGE
ncbi:MAG: hypothetical protein R3E96_01340 [Planctomycetota bacterium]